MESEVLTYYYFYLSYLQKLEQFNACLNNLSMEAINSINKSKINQFQFDCSRSDRSSSRNDSECSTSDSNDQSYTGVGSHEKDSHWIEFKERQKNFNKYVKQRFIIEFGPIENLTYKKIKRSSFDVMNKIKEEAKQKFLPENLTDNEFKNYWKSALNTIRQTRYRYRSKLNRNKNNNS